VRIAPAMATAMLALLIAPSRGSAQFPPDSFTNLKVLPRDINRDSLVALMGRFTRALGVRCTYCHVGEENRPLSTYNFAADDKPTKRTARVMLQMVHHINEEHLAEVEKRVQPPVTVECATCHRGTTTPRMLQDVLLIAYQAGGLDSSLKVYRGLRERYYGRFTYDFSEVPLADVAGRIAAQGNLGDAERLHALNVEMNPASVFAKRQHATLAIGRAFLADGADSGAAAYARLKASYGAPVNEGLLNQVGYALLGIHQVEAAILAFSFAVKEFPNSSNAYDSLGEAYMTKGDKPRAIENYERSLALDPSNTNAQDRLKTLRGR
jgi:tetratricopeptide (TPR) repeat protein